MPVHPTLAAILAEWKLKGWPEMMGRAPTPEDLVVPMPRPTNRGPRVEHGRMRTDHHSYKRLVKDLEVLGLRHRRGHDLRRTMISLARTDGARKDILELCTHTPRKSGSAIDLYTTFPWEALCAEVAKLKVQRHERGQLVRLPLAASAEKESPEAPDGARGLATSLATVSQKAESFPGDAMWRRRESNPQQGGSKTPSRSCCYRLTPRSHVGSFSRPVPPRPVLIPAGGAHRVHMRPHHQEEVVARRERTGRGPLSCRPRE